jgi:hypothetical protein
MVLEVHMRHVKYLQLEEFNSESPVMQMAESVNAES